MEKLTEGKRDNERRWVPSKYVLSNGRLGVTNDSNELAVGSRLIAMLVANHYDRAVPEHARGSLVDLGCGKAPLYGLYSQFVDQIVTVDWPQSQHGSEYVDVECDLNERLVFEDEEFDTIILSDVLEHVTDPQQLCVEMARILKPGGKTLLNVPFMYPIHERPYDYYRYTDQGLRHLLATAGFSIVELTPIGGSPEVLTDLLAKHSAKLPIMGEFIARTLQRAAVLFTHTGLGQRISGRSGSLWPFGYFVVAQK